MAIDTTPAPKIYVCHYLNADMCLMVHTRDHPVNVAHVCVFVSPFAYESGQDIMQSVYQEYWKRRRSAIDG